MYCPMCVSDTSSKCVVYGSNSGDFSSSALATTSSPFPGYVLTREVHTAEAETQTDESMFKDDAISVCSTVKDADVRSELDDDRDAASEAVPGPELSAQSVPIYECPSTLQIVEDGGLDGAGDNIK